MFTGPAGAYNPDPGADWHLMVGDESALPAIAASLEAVPPGVPVVVRLICDGPEYEIALATPGDLDLAWVHRPDPLADAVAALELPAGRAHAFVHGEAGETRAVRRHLLADRGLDARAAVLLALLASRPDRRGLACDQGGLERRSRARRDVRVG